MSFPPHEVYSKCLLGAYGYPLWTPQLNLELRESYQLEGLKIGDVGVISQVDGSFDVLFNITLRRNEQPKPGLLRDDFTPVLLDQESDLATQRDAVTANGVIPSTSVQLTSRDIKTYHQTPSRADYEFSLCMKTGAMLILPEGAQSCDLRNEEKFLNEAIRHGVDWYEYATKAGRLIPNDSFYLITGFHKARSWSLGAAGRGDSSLRVGNKRSVKFKVGPIYRGSVTAQAYSWVAATHGFIGRVGPMFPYEIPTRVLGGRTHLGFNQTVFLRGFRITVNKILFLKTVSVKTQRGTFFRFKSQLASFLSRKSESTSSRDATDNTVEQDFSVSRGQLYADARMTIDRMPDVSQTFHPGDLINQYMLKKNPDARVAITHDNLWIDMLQSGRLELADFRKDRLEEVLPRNDYVIQRHDDVLRLERSCASEDSGIAMGFCPRRNRHNLAAALHTVLPEHDVTLSGDESFLDL